MAGNVPGVSQGELGALSNKVGTEQGKAMERIKRLGMSPRQQRLNRLWSWFRSEAYSSRKIDWNGQEVLDPLEHEALATQGYVPPGFVKEGADSLPLKFRRPTVPYALVKVIVNRFTGLLFSKQRHPRLRVNGDTQTEEYANAMVEAARLWPTMIQARNFGGAMGSVCIGFQFLDGKPVVEVHDPRWTHPDFVDRHTLKVRSIEKRYMYQVDELDEEKGTYKSIPYWYRRTIDEQKDVLFEPTPVGNGEEPQWQVQQEVKHALGFCPVIWVQNMPMADDIDGDEDCQGIYDMVERIDALLSQAHRGTIQNSDPTLVITTKEPMTEIRKGSDNALKIPDGDAKYLEMSGGGVKAAREYAQELRGYALEVAQCVLEQPDSQGQKTATEVLRNYSSMIAKADVLREQYGEKGIKPLVDMMLKAARQVTQPQAGPDGGLVRGKLTLPMKVDTNAGQATTTEHQLGPGGVLELQWPGYFEPSLDDITKAVGAASAAQLGGLVDDEHAVKFVAPFFEVEDPQAMLEQIRSQKADDQAQMMASAMGAMPHGGTPAPPGGNGGIAGGGGPQEGASGAPTEPGEALAGMG